MRPICVVRIFFFNTKKLLPIAKRCLALTSRINEASVRHRCFGESQNCFCCWKIFFWMVAALCTCEIISRNPSKLEILNASFERPMFPQGPGNMFPQWFLDWINTLHLNRFTISSSLAFQHWTLIQDSNCEPGFCNQVGWLFGFLLGYNCGRKNVWSQYRTSCWFPLSHQSLTSSCTRCNCIRRWKWQVWLILNPQVFFAQARCNNGSRSNNRGEEFTQETPTGVNFHLSGLQTYSSGHEEWLQDIPLRSLSQELIVNALISFDLPQQCCSSKVLKGPVPTRNGDLWRVVLVWLVGEERPESFNSHRNLHLDEATNVEWCFFTAVAFQLIREKKHICVPLTKEKRQK